MSTRRPAANGGPEERNLSDAMKPGWNRHMSLQEAASTVTRLARYEVGVVSELPEESSLRVEINGVLAGSIRCLPDAPAELAIGWTFMHGFFSPGDLIESVTVDGDRVSLMIGTPVDIDYRRLVAVGWREHEDDEVGAPMELPEPFVIHADVLVEIVRDAIRVMAKDRSRDGFIHAALATEQGPHCVARDLTVQAAVAKVLGWRLREGSVTEAPILVVRGMVDRSIIAAVGSLGVSIVVTSGIVTAGAFREALGREVSILGMATNQRPGLLVDAGHVMEDDQAPPPGGRT
jgi:formate dehydrogenase accessory protein FdhD